MASSPDRTPLLRAQSGSSPSEGITHITITDGHQSSSSSSSDRSPLLHAAAVTHSSPRRAQSATNGFPSTPSVAARAWPSSPRNAAAAARRRSIFENEPQLAEAPKGVGLDALFFRRLWFFIKMGFRHPCSRMSIRAYTLLIAAAVTSMSLTLLITPRLASFMEALVQRDTKWLFSLLIQIAVIFVALLFVVAWNNYGAEITALEWRKAITERMHEELFLPMMPYTMGSLDKRIDNTDQRMCSSALEFTSQFVSIVLGGFLAGPFALLSSFFSIGVAFYAIYPLGWLPSTMVFVFFVISSILVRLQMNPITRLTFIQQRYEGDFRFIHTRLRTFAESVAFYRGEEKERETADGAFAMLYHNFRQLIKRSSWLYFTIQMSGRGFGTLIGEVAIMCLLYFNMWHFDPKHGISEVTTAATNIGSAVSGLLALPAQLSHFSTIAGELSRLAQMWDTMAELKEEVLRAAQNGVASQLSSPQGPRPIKATRQTSGEDTKLLDPAHSPSDYTSSAPNGATIVTHEDVTNDDYIDIDDDVNTARVSSATPINSSSRASPVIAPRSSSRIIVPAAAVVPRSPSIIVSPFLPVSPRAHDQTSPGGTTRAIVRRNGLIVRFGPIIRMERVTVTTPNSGTDGNNGNGNNGGGGGNGGNGNGAGGGRTLFANLSFLVTPGQSLLICGPSGCGKSSVLRTIAGLWPANKGRLTKPEKIVNRRDGESSLFFVPQRPFLTLGTLRANLVYPLEESEIVRTPLEDNRLVNILSSVGLAYLAVRWSLDYEANWCDLLSGGEQQRLGLARVFYHRPTYALLDEGTSALDSSMEAKCMKACIREGITLISVGHRPSLLAYHQQKLTLSRDGTYILEMIAKEMHDNGIMAVAHAQSDDAPDDDIKTKQPIKAEEVTPPGYTKVFWRRFRFLLGLGFGRCCSQTSRYVYLALLFLLIQAVATFMFTDLSARITTALAHGDYEEANFYIVVGAGAVCVGFIFGSIAIWLTGIVSLYWRRAMYFYASNLYFGGMIPYRANAVDKRLDNLDNRIVNDIRLLAETASGWFLGTSSVLGTGIFSSMISTVMYTVSAASIGWLPPLAMYVYVGLAFMISQCLMSRIVKATYIVAIAEGAFRYVHGRLRTFAESIAFFHGEKKEHSDANRTFQALYTAQQRYIWAYLPLRTFSSSTVFFAMLIRTVSIVLHVTYIDPIDGKDDNDRLYKLLKLMNQLTNLALTLGLSVGYLARLSTIAGMVHRVGEMFEVLEELNQRRISQSKAQFLLGEHIELIDGTLTTNEGMIIINKLSLDVGKISLATGERSGNLLIMGASGCGKSSILRVIGGLLEFSGTVIKPHDIGNGGIFFLPQSPYITQGSLRENMLYPHSPILLSRKSNMTTTSSASSSSSSSHRNGAIANNPSEDKLLTDLLRFVQLDYLLDKWGLDRVASWAEILSLGEQQRLQFCRVFYHQPKYCLMDESTSALDLDLEEQCLRRCQQMGISMILVAHRYSCAPFFTNILRVTNGGRSTISVIDHTNDGPTASSLLSSKLSLSHASPASQSLLSNSANDGERKTNITNDIDNDSNNSTPSSTATTN